MFSMAMGMITVVAPLADPGRRPARAEHARAPAGQGHGHGRPLQELHRRRPADPARLARRGQGRDALRRRDPQGLVADPETFARRAAQGAGFGGPQGMAAGADRVLGLPRHGRAGDGDAGPRRLQPAGARDAPALRLDAAASAGAGDGAGGLRGGDRRLGDHRGRPPALYGARPAAHGGLGLAAAGAGGRHLAAGFHRRLLHRVRRRHLLHPAADEPPAAARARRGPSATSRCGRPASRRRRRCPTRSPRRAGGTDHAHLRPAHHLGLHHRLRDLRLCRDGRLRSRHRHPLLLDPGRPRARHRDEHHRPGMGRQRDLAGAGRRRPSGGLSAGLRHDPVGALRADRGHAAGADLPRRRLRVPLARPAPPSLLGCRLQHRLDHGGLRAGRHPGRPAAGHRRQGSRLCRRLVRLAARRSACWSA